jgi:hypothetical protein
MRAAVWDVVWHPPNSDEPIKEPRYLESSWKVEGMVPAPGRKLKARHVDDTRIRELPDLWIRRQETGASGSGFGFLDSWLLGFFLLRISHGRRDSTLGTSEFGCGFPDAFGPSSDPGQRRSMGKKRCFLSGQRWREPQSNFFSEHLGGWGGGG